MCKLRSEMRRSVVGDFPKTAELFNQYAPVNTCKHVGGCSSCTGRGTCWINKERLGIFDNGCGLQTKTCAGCDYPSIKCYACRHYGRKCDNRC
jgi:hypothetical protein